jgi:hypothetical protein
MPRKFLLLPVLILLAGLSAPASAAYPFFGSKETIRVIMVTSIKGENGVPINLGRRLVLKAFLLPYNIEDGGFVLVAADDPKKFLPMPTGARLATLQANGFLPKPLPPFRLKMSDYIAGYVLWWVLLAVILLPVFVLKMLESKEVQGETD